MDDFERFKEILKAHQKSVLQFLKKLEQKSDSAKSAETLSKLVEKEKVKVAKQLADIQEHTITLEKEIGQLLRTKDTLVSDNLLLEYKKKDLLLLTDKLEEANSEISVKNKELLHQQQKITEQSEHLNVIHREILAKNEELEQQKESLLDQSDYLHEANQTITLMHEEVQKQKNEILQKNEELLNLNNEKNNLIGIVAHDLKSPLNQMKGLLSIIKMSNSLDKETLSCVNMMENSADRLTTLIAKILDVEAIESQQLNLIQERTSLTEVLNSIADRYEIAAHEKSITLRREIGQDIFILADRIYTSQVFDNLLSNAIKFSPNDRNIFIKLSSLKENAVAEIKDEGPGISDDDKKKLFGKYQKLSAKPTGNETSTGLGLSIVKKFVESMNGRIWCESELGKGASFFVSFKLY
jgi:signal transduction histidine kinase